MKTIEAIPDFDTVANKSGAKVEPLNPLETFVLHHDPINARSAEFRLMLFNAMVWWCAS